MSDQRGDQSDGRAVRDGLTWSAPAGDVSVRVELAELFADIV